MPARLSIKFLRQVIEDKKISASERLEAIKIWLAEKKEVRDMIIARKGICPHCGRGKWLKSSDEKKEETSFALTEVLSRDISKAALYEEDK